MSPLDRELMAALGELVLARQPKIAAEKQAFIFGPAGKAVDWVLRRGFSGARRAAPSWKTLFDWGAKKPYNIAMEASGIRGLSNEQALLAALRKKRGAGAAWNTVRQLAEDRGVKSPVTAFQAFFSPMETLSPRISEAGQARWLLAHLRDPVKRKQFLVGATPAQKAAVKRLEPFFDQAGTAMSTSLAANLLPVGIIGGPVAYQISKGVTDEGERPVVSSVHPGILGETGGADDKGALGRLWGGVGESVKGISPGLGGWISEHPYMSTAAAAGLAGGGLYGLTKMFGGNQGQNP